MCVVEDFINLMAQSGWFFTIETWYQTAKDMVIHEIHMNPRNLSADSSHSLSFHLFHRTMYGL